MAQNYSCKWPFYLEFVRENYVIVESNAEARNVSKFQAVNFFFILHTPNTQKAVVSEWEQDILVVSKGNVQIQNNVGLLSSLRPTVFAREVELQGQRKPPILSRKEMIIYHLVIHTDRVTRLTTGEHSEAPSESRVERKKKSKGQRRLTVRKPSTSLHDRNLKVRPCGR